MSQLAGNNEQQPVKLWIGIHIQDHMFHLRRAYFMALVAIGDLCPRGCIAERREYDSGRLHDLLVQEKLGRSHNLNE